MAVSETSTFLTPGLVAKEHGLASLHIRRDQSLPVLLSSVATSAEDEGYAEGMVTNTRFGSFPHTTIINMPWGSQIRASRVDTGSRGRKELSRKRKSDAIASDEDDDEAAAKDAIAAASGFLHVLQPTPESWTYSLPHRTQVVYTSDYSYILHRIRARPGSVVIEAGSGSGSFTHAAARAVFDIYPISPITNGHTTGSTARGKVYSYEFHSERWKSVSQEMLAHGLSSIVSTTHRDVYNDGFLLPKSGNEVASISPVAGSVFLDLPSPWLALPHLTRAFPSALDPNTPVYLCTFSPCIEQAQKTITYLRRYNWLEIEMVEVQNKRIDIRREFTGFQYDGMRGVNATAASVDDALTKLKEVEQRSRDFHAGQSELSATKKQIRQANTQQDAQKVMFREGSLMHRSEPELKTHTSYLVFAVLPSAWTEADEDRESKKWAKPVRVDADIPKSQRQLKKEAKLRKKSRDRREEDEDMNGESNADEPSVDI